MSHTINKTSPQLFIDCLELVQLMMDECQWSALMVLAKTDRFFRALVFEKIRVRIIVLLSNFVSQDDIPLFFDLLDRTNAVVAGALVRCIMSVDVFPIDGDVLPLQLNIVVPLVKDSGLHDGSAINYRRWRRFLLCCGFVDECGSGEGLAPFHLCATATHWSTLQHDLFPGRRVSLVLSKTTSALSPILQACHTSSFFALSSTRFYCLYPKLFAAKVNLSMKPRMPSLKCVFDSFNYGLVSFTKTDGWGVFPRGRCGEACPSVWRRTRGLKGIGVFRWGGFNSNKDRGDAVSEGNGYGDKNEIWKNQSDCRNVFCRAFLLYTNLLHMIF